MFTGIIEELGIITDIKSELTNKHFTIATPLAKGQCYLKPGWMVIWYKAISMD